MCVNKKTMARLSKTTLPCPRCRSKQTELVRDTESGEIVFTDGKCIITCKTCDRTEIVVLRRSWLGKLSAWPETMTSNRYGRWFLLRYLSWIVAFGAAFGLASMFPKRWQMSVGSWTVAAWWIFNGVAAIRKQTTDHWSTMSMSMDHSMGSGETHYHGIEAVKGGIGWLIMGVFCAILGALPFLLELELR